MDHPSRAAERQSIVALGALSLVAIIALVIVIGFTAGHPLAAALLLVPVIALPAIAPLIFCAWAFAVDTNSHAMRSSHRRRV